MSEKNPFGTPDPKTEFAAALVAAAAIKPIHDVHGVPVAVLPHESGWAAIPLDVDAYRDKPSRRRGQLKFRDVESFVAYVKRHMSEQTLVLADGRGGVKAVLNHHGESDGGAGWGDHVAVLEREQTKHYQAWMQVNEEWISHRTLATFLEDRIAEIAEPDGAMLQAISENFSASQSIQFTRGARLDNGDVHLDYKVETSPAAGIVIPSALSILLQPFRDSDEFLVEAKLRYRIHDGDAQFQFKLDEALEERIVELLEETNTEITKAIDVPVLLGGIVLGADSTAAG